MHDQLSQSWSKGTCMYDSGRWRTMRIPLPLQQHRLRYSVIYSYTSLNKYFHLFHSLQPLHKEVPRPGFSWVSIHWTWALEEGKFHSWPERKHSRQPRVLEEMPSYWKITQWNLHQVLLHVPTDGRSRRRPHPPVTHHRGHCLLCLSQTEADNICPNPNPTPKWHKPRTSRWARRGKYLWPIWGTSWDEGDQGKTWVNLNHRSVGSLKGCQISYFKKT